MMRLSSISSSVFICLCVVPVYVCLRCTCFLADWKVSVPTETKVQLTCWAMPWAPTLSANARRFVDACALSFEDDKHNQYKARKQTNKSKID